MLNTDNADDFVASTAVENAVAASIASIVGVDASHVDVTLSKARRLDGAAAMVASPRRLKDQVTVSYVIRLTADIVANTNVTTVSNDLTKVTPDTLTTKIGEELDKTSAANQFTFNVLTIVPPQVIAITTTTVGGGESSPDDPIDSHSQRATTMGVVAVLATILPRLLFNF